MVRTSYRGVSGLQSSIMNAEEFHVVSSEHSCIDDDYNFCTPPKARWKQLLAIGELELESGHSELRLPPYCPPHSIEDSHYPLQSSALGLSNIPFGSSSMSRTNSSISIEVEEDLFEHSSLMTSFPSTRRPSVCEYPASPKLQPIPSFDDSIHPLYLHNQQEDDSDIEIHSDISSEDSFGHDSFDEYREEELRFIPIRASPPLEHSEEADTDLSGERRRRRTLSFGSQSSEEDEVIITPFSDIMNLPRSSLGNINMSRYHQTNRNLNEASQRSFESTSYPTQDGCIGLGIDFGHYHQHKIPTRSDHPTNRPSMRGRSIDWSSFKINSLSTSSSDLTTSYDNGKRQSTQLLETPYLLPSPIPYDSPLYR